MAHSCNDLCIPNENLHAHTIEWTDVAFAKHGLSKAIRWYKEKGYKIVSYTETTAFTPSHPARDKYPIIAYVFMMRHPLIDKVHNYNVRMS